MLVYILVAPVIIRMNACYYSSLDLLALKMLNFNYGASLDDYYENPLGWRNKLKSNSLF